MLLNQLTMQEREIFISLSVHAAKANGIIAEKEYAMIEEYCKEMGIAFFDAKNIRAMEDVVEVFKESSYKNKKIIMLEILGLVYADGSYDKEENAFVFDFATRIGLGNDVVNYLERLIVKYLELVKEIVDTIQ